MLTTNFQTTCKRMALMLALSLGMANVIRAAQPSPKPLVLMNQNKYLVPEQPLLLNQNESPALINDGDAILSNQNQESAPLNDREILLSDQNQESPSIQNQESLSVQNPSLNLREQEDKGLALSEHEYNPASNVQDSGQDEVPEGLGNIQPELRLVLNDNDR